MEKKRVGKIVKKVFSNFSKKEVKFHHNALHAYKETPAIRTHVLGSLSKMPVSIMSICLNKKIESVKRRFYHWIRKFI